ncbi:uncharacterized protein [Littorina saxatilis]|uniref:ETS domain-containing protein n=1 Tax=Littorina saxatilis TaxID=31220 RepID=A0AAN9B4J8_9CAEN
MATVIIIYQRSEPALGQSDVLSYSPLEGTCYAQLQPVAMDFSIGSLIASSTNMCLPDGLGDASCAGYPVGSQSYHHYSYSSDDSIPPTSPENELSAIQDVLHQRMIGRTASDDDEDSVMFDFEDLDFLDQCSRDSDSLSNGSRTDYPTVIVADQAYFTAPPSLHRPSPRHHMTTTTSSPATTHHHHHQHPHHHRPISSWSLHYNDAATVNRYDDPRFVLPPTPTLSPSSSPSPRLQEVREPFPPMMNDLWNEDDDDEDAEYKPYCDSRRGAKKNLLWKFLLWVLDHQPDLAQWTDMRKGVFKFVDTARISTQWGQRKHKRDMTFEKLSRGIRHYYKRGLMERLSNTRLVYKFNWEKVPKRYRKA